MGQFQPRLGDAPVISRSPQHKPEAISILSIPLIYGQNREPTSGLEPLTCSLRVISQTLHEVA